LPASPALVDEVAGAGAVVEADSDPLEVVAEPELLVEDAILREF